MLLTEKSPLNFLYLGWIERAFPNARVVHCVRDSLDTMISCFFTDFRARGLSFTFDLNALRAFYADYERLMEFWDEALSIPVLRLDYESLVENPEPEIRRLVEFVGLDWNRNCLEHHRTNRITHTASHAQVREPIHRRARGRHLNYAAQLAGLGWMRSA